MIGALPPVVAQTAVVMFSLKGTDHLLRLLDIDSAVGRTVNDPQRYLA